MEKKRNKIYVFIVAMLFFGITAVTWLKPSDDFSVTDRRQLKQFPVLSAEAILNGKFMEQFEEYTLDQFPLRDTFRSIKAITHLFVLGQADNNDVYRADGYVSKLDYPLSQKALDNAVRKFQSIYDTYIVGSDAKLYHSIIPDKNAFLAEVNGYPAYDYEEMYAYFQENLPDMFYIDITDLLELEDFIKPCIRLVENACLLVSGINMLEYHMRQIINK